MNMHEINHLDSQHMKILCHCNLNPPERMKNLIFDIEKLHDTNNLLIQPTPAKQIPLYRIEPPQPRANTKENCSSNARQKRNTIDTQSNQDTLFKIPNSNRLRTLLLLDLL